MHWRFTETKSQTEDDGKVTSELMGILRCHSPLTPGKKNTCAANINKPSFRWRMTQGVVFSPPVVMATVPKLEMGLNPWPVSSFAFSGLCGTAPDENGARAQTYEWLFVWWSDTITNWVTQLTGSQSDAQFDSCVFFLCVWHFLNVSCVPFFLQASLQCLCLNGKINDV